MKYNLLAIAFGISISAAQAAETILGVYILSRHAKFSRRGGYFRDRYITSNATNKVFEVASDEVVNSQIRVVTTDDTVLMNSAQAFLQGLYPAVGSLASETLRNGTVISGVSGGYQLIPIHILDNGVNKEDTAWLQGTSKCANAINDSKNFEASEEFKSTEESSFKNAYAIYDIINYALLHNETIPSSELLTGDAVFQLRTLADKQQWGFAYNESTPVRAIAGSTFAGDVLTHFEDVIQSKGSKPKVGVQFNAYGTFLSFFGLAQLPTADSNFYGLPDYGSTMAFELFTYEAVESFPDIKDINVRFLFHNGSTVDGGELTAYPLFGKMETEMPWTTFADEMRGFAVATTDHWCRVCGIEGGICPVYNDTIEPLTHQTHHGLSSAVSGVVGALVTLVVVLVVEGLVVAIAGLAIVKKKDVKRAGRGKEAESVSS